MSLETLLQSRRLRKTSLPPHRVHAILRLDGNLVKITSRRIFRRSRSTRSWLRTVVRDLEASYENVDLERFRLLSEAPSSREPPEEETDMKRVVFVMDDGTRVKGLVDAFDPVAMRFVGVREVDAQDKLVQLHDLDVLSIHAAFFVEDLAITGKGAALRTMGRGDPARPAGGRRVELTMVWGERLRGVLRPLDARGLWYEFFVVDPERAANLKRAIISRRAIARKAPLDRGAR